MARTYQARVSNSRMSLAKYLSGESVPSKCTHSWCSSTWYRLTCALIWQSARSCRSLPKNTGMLFTSLLAYGSCSSASSLLWECTFVVAHAYTSRFTSASRSHRIALSSSVASLLCQPKAPWLCLPCRHAVALHSVSIPAASRTISLCCGAMWVSLYCSQVPSPQSLHYTWTTTSTISQVQLPLPSGHPTQRSTLWQSMTNYVEQMASGQQCEPRRTGVFCAARSVIIDLWEMKRRGSVNRAKNQKMLTVEYHNPARTPP